MDWLNDERTQGLDKGQEPRHHHADAPQGRGRVLVAALVVLALVLLAGGWAVRRHQAQRPTTNADEVTASSPTTTASPEQTADPTPTPSLASTSGTASASPLTGAPLAKAWLTAYLTRPQGAHDGSWTHAVAPYSDPSLVTALHDNEDMTPLAKLASWSVKSIAPGGTKHAPSTRTRQVSSWVVQITDGHQTVAQLYTLTAYVDGSGHWTVQEADQGYSSSEH